MSNSENVIMEIYNFKIRIEYNFPEIIGENIILKSYTNSDKRLLKKWFGDERRNDSVGLILKRFGN